MENQKSEYYFQDTTATKKIFDLKKRIRAVAGGTGASKTISILVWLIDYCQRKQDREKLATVVSESYPHLEKGAIFDFENIMKDRGYWKDSLWQGQKHTYRFETGNELQFASIDTYEKTHGPRRDVLFINEANNLAYNIADQLIIRTREIVWLDWNPTSEFWFYTEMQGKREDVDFITLTFLDNEALDTVTKDEILSHKNNKNWWNVYGLGQLGSLEGQIYHDWQVIDEIPFEARLERYGLDFGYTNDPTAIVAIYYHNGGYILDEITYLKGLSNKDIADILKNKPMAMVVADSAEPKSIDEITTYGCNIQGSDKGQGSVQQGIQYVQQKRISVTKRSTNLLKEYRNYLWQIDKDGKVINEPEVVFNHLMDALRYGMNSLDDRRNTFTPKERNWAIA